MLFSFDFDAFFNHDITFRPCVWLFLNALDPALLSDEWCEARLFDTITSSREVRWHKLRVSCSDF